MGVIGTGFPSSRDYSKKNLNNVINKITAWEKVRLLGSAVLSLALVAIERIDVYY